MIAALFIVVAPVVFAAPANERPPFNIPRHFTCVGSNRSNEPVNVDVVIEGDEHNTTFVLTPLKASAWPRAPQRREKLRGSFFRSDEASLWYWVATDYDQDNYGFGFDVRVSGAGQSAIRFSREEYAPKLTSSEEMRFDSKGAYLDDVPCKPAPVERG